MKTSDVIPKTFTLWKNTSNQTKYHVLSEIKDGEEEIIVLKNWLYSKKRWAYQAKPKWEVIHYLEYEKNRK